MQADNEDYIIEYTPPGYTEPKKSTYHVSSPKSEYTAENRTAAINKPLAAKRDDVKTSKSSISNII